SRLSRDRGIAGSRERDPLLAAGCGSAFPCSPVPALRPEPAERAWGFPFVSWTTFQTRCRNRCTPSMPRLFQGPPPSQGPMNIRYARTFSEPTELTYPSGFTTLPRDLLIFPTSPHSLAP